MERRVKEGMGWMKGTWGMETGEKRGRKEVSMSVTK
jgi:hypothetical protein